MKKKFTITKLILSTFMMMLSFTIMGANINASYNEPSTIFMLSDELVDAGYRMQGCSSDAVQCFYQDNRVIGVELKLGANQRVTGFPAINNGKNYKTVDVEFRQGNEVVSKPVYNTQDGQYHPKPIDFGRVWEDQTTFVAYFRTATIKYYEGETFLHSETINVGENAMTYVSEKAEDDSAAYTFDKWVDEAGNEANLTGINFSLNVYATYTVTPKFDVKFMNEDTPISNSKVLDGTTAVMNEVPTKDDSVSEDISNVYRTSYTFSHWNVNNTEVDPATYAIHENTVFEAVYDETETVTKKTVVVPSDNITPSNPTTPIALNTNPLNTAPTFTTNPNPETTIESVVDNTTPLAGGAQTEVVNDNQTPLANPIDTTTWSFINLIFMLMTIAFGIASLKDNKKTHNTWLSVATFVVSIIIFVTTQDITATIGFVDSWTIVMAILLFIAILQMKNKKQSIHN